jgi:anti-sigma factor RsiW
VIAHAAHPSDELLSAYLDGELAERQVETVEDHLAACPGCRTRLDGLRRVVRALGRLERAAPPQVLQQRVERRVALAGRQAGFLERLEDGLRGLSLESPMVVTFAVVLTLVTMVYVVSSGVARLQGDGAPASGAARSGEPLVGTVVVRQVAGRDLVRRGDAWVEVDALGEAVRSVPLDSEAGRDLAQRHPWVARLLGEPVPGGAVAGEGTAGEGTAGAATDAAGLETAQAVIFRVDDGFVELCRSCPPAS